MKKLNLMKYESEGNKNASMSERTGGIISDIVKDWVN